MEGAKFQGFDMALSRIFKSCTMKLLEELCAIHAPSGSEAPMKEFLLRYIKKEKKKWKSKPVIIEGEEFQDCIILKFGKPRTAIFAHMDSIGFTVRYQNQLVTIGSPDASTGTKLVGEDSLGPIECELVIDPDHHAYYQFGRAIDRGTTLTYKPNFHDTGSMIESPYLDDRLGIYNALQVASKLTNGVIVFSCWEEHGGGSVPYLADYIYRKWGVRQALISDVTWATEGVLPGEGVAISLRDRNVPRKVFLDSILAVAKKSKIPFQLEVEAAGSSDGGELQRGHLPFDWCFIGPPSHHPHSPLEKVHKDDIDSMIQLYHALMKVL